MENEFKDRVPEQRKAGAVAGETTGAQPAPIASDSWLLAAGIIIAAGLLVYANSFGGAFIFDDTVRIVGNRNIRSVWPLWQFLDYLGQLRPLVRITFAINYAVGGLDVWGYHAFNLSVHILSALTLFGILRRTLGLASLRDRFGKYSSSIALAVTLIWIVHPLQTQAVTYIYQRCESMMSLFYLLTLYCVIRGWDSSRQGRWHGGAIIFCALGMMSKEMMVTAPLIVFLYDYFFLSGSLRQVFRRRKTLYAGLASTWGILFLLMFNPSSEVLKEFMVPRKMSQVQYALTQFGVIVHYLRLAVWPDVLVLDYDWPPAVTAGEIVPYAILIAALVAGTIWAFLRRQPSWFLGAWFFLVLAPTSSIMPLHDAAVEYRMYLPLASVVTLLVIGAYFAGGMIVNHSGSVRAKFLAEACGGALLVSVVVLLGYLTVVRNRDYQSEFAIWSDTVGKRPQNARAQINFGVALRNLGRYEDAVMHFNKALRLKPDYASAHNNLGIILVKLGRFEEAFAHYQQAVRLKPDYASGHNNLGAFLLNVRNDPQEAIEHFKKSLQIKPDYAQAHNNLGVALYKLGRLNEAVAHYQEAVRLEPDFTQWHKNLGLTFLRLGRLNDAVAHYQETLRLEPDCTEAHNNLGIAFLELGRLKDAAAHFQQAVRIKPDHPEAHVNLGIALRELGQLQEAIEHFEQSLRLRSDYPETHYNLGIALTRVGRYSDALIHFQEVLRLDPDHVDAAMKLKSLIRQIEETENRQKDNILKE
jgi:tetratricopeptide (TPR) repeat protein